MNDYRVTYVQDGTQQEVELVAANVREIEAMVPEDAEIITVRFLRARGFSCRSRLPPPYRR